jgi:hypothetical protein
LVFPPVKTQSLLGEHLVRPWRTLGLPQERTWSCPGEDLLLPRRPHRVSAQKRNHANLDRRGTGPGRTGLRGHRPLADARIRLAHDDDQAGAPSGWVERRRLSDLSVEWYRGGLSAEKVGLRLVTPLKSKACLAPRPVYPPVAIGRTLSSAVYSPVGTALNRGGNRQTAKIFINIVSLCHYLITLLL